MSSKGEVTNFLEHIQENDVAAKFFAQFPPKDLFSNNWKVIKGIIDSMNKIPIELLEINDSFGMCFITKYITIVYPSFFPDGLYHSFINLLAKLPSQDLNLAVSLFTQRLSVTQKEDSVLKLPDCGSTFYYLGSLFMDQNLFLTAFQRTFSSLHIVPYGCQKYITEQLRKSVKYGPARQCIQDIIDVAIRHNSKILILKNQSIMQPNRTTRSPLDIVLSAIVDAYPDSLIHTTPLTVQNAINSIFKAKEIPLSALKLLLLTNSQVMLTFPQIAKFIQLAPSMLFEFINRLPEGDSYNNWYLILVKASEFDIKIENRDFLVTVFYSFLLACLSSRSLLQVFQSTNLTKFLLKLLDNMEDTIYHFALLGVFLLQARCFAEIANTILKEPNFAESFEVALTRSQNKIAIFDTIFYVMDPTRKCPFANAVDAPLMANSVFPQPSSPFVFKVLPTILGAMMRISISDSIPKNQPQKQTPIRKRLGLERTHSMVHLRLSNASEEEEEEDGGENEGESHTAFIDSTDEILPEICGGDIEQLTVMPLLQFFVTELTPMYEDAGLSSMLYTLSMSQNLLPLLPFAHASHECFVFLARALGLSCPFTVFATMYEQLFDNFSKTTEFLALLSKYSQLVTDFLYVTAPIPLSLASPCSSLAMWVRPHSDSTVVSISLKSVEILARIRENELILTPSNARLQLPPRIGGWIMITIVVSGGYVTFSANLSSVRVPVPADNTGFNSVVVGSGTSHFELQSVRIFKPAMTEDDILFLFALGPDFKEFIHSSFIHLHCKTTPKYVTDSGFVSQLYLPFIDKYDFDKKLESNIMSLLEVSLSPPFKSVRHLARGAQKMQSSISLDRRRSYPFLNALHCVGGIYLILHLTGEILLKYPELGPNIWMMLSNILNYHPAANCFLEETSGYALIGHLLWVGTAKAEDSIDIAMSNLNGVYYITNPLVIEQWMMEAQLFYSECDAIIQNLIGAMDVPRNFQILKRAKTFQKIVNLLCSPCTHSYGFLSQVGKLAIKLTETSTAAEHAQLVFDRLILCHFTFAEKGTPNTIIDRTGNTGERTISSTTTVALISVLRTILMDYGPKVDLELFLPAIVTSTPAVQVSLSVLLIERLSPDYLLMLGNLFKILPHIDGLEAGMFSMLSDMRGHINIVQLSTCFIAFATHEEGIHYLDNLCRECVQSTEALVDQVVIAMNQIAASIIHSEITNLQGVKLSEFDKSTQSVMDFFSFVLVKTVSLNIPDTLLKFFLSLFAVPPLPVYRLSAVVFTMMTALVRGLRGHSGAPADKAMNHVTSFASFVFQKLRLTPGAIDAYILEIVEKFVTELISMSTENPSSDNIGRLVSFLADLFHFNSDRQFLAKLQPLIQGVPKITKQKRYQEMLSRMDELQYLTPSKFVSPYQDELKLFESKWAAKDQIDMIALFELTCRSIHHQTYTAVTFDITDPNSDAVIDLWHNVFHFLQFPGPNIFKDCPTKWMLSDRSSNFQQRAILIPMNPSIDRQYSSYWDTKYSEPAPKVRLTLKEVLRFTPISLHMANDVEFSSHALRLSGISNYDGVVVVTCRKIRFYQRSKEASEQFCEVVQTIPINKIVCIRLKTFRHQQTGIEIICKDSTCYLFAFDTNNLRQLFIDLMTGKGIPIMKDINKKGLQEATRRWIEGSMSNFDYLLYLNEISGRSWNDFTQYPIFPWVLREFKNDIDLKNPEFYRNLEMPIFAQTAEQQEQCIHYYNTTDALSNEPHCTPNFISNVGSTIYFLVRIEPFTDEEISFQSGSLDAADRTFQSFDISYSLMTAPGNKNALELVPEFYFNPDVLTNLNHINFPVSPISQRTVDDVVLPRWASSPRDLVHTMRRALESPIVSGSLHEWIDLIWGFRRRGEAAFERFNVYQNTVFEFNQSEVMDDRVLLKALKGQIHNCGQAAAQLFSSPHPKRNCDVREASGELVFHLLRKPVAFEKSLLNFTPTSDRWVSVASDKSAIKAIRLSQGALEGSKGGGVVTIGAFSEEIEPTCFDVMGTTLVTGHAMPVINLWKVRDGIENIMSLRGHIASITSVSIVGQPWSMLAAGHDDGCVSLFSMNPARFLRILHSDSRLPVAFVRVGLSNGDVLVAQCRPGMSIISLWSVNGTFVNTVTLEARVIDAVSTSFAEGTKGNFFFLLCDDNSILTFRANDLFMLGSQELTHPQPVSLFLPKEKSVLFVTHADGHLSCWKIQ